MTSLFRRTTAPAHRDRSADTQRVRSDALFVPIISLAFLIVVGVSRHGLFDEIRYDIAGTSDRPGYFPEHGLTKLDISIEQYPGPGECRIWFRDLPADVQPPAGACKELASRMPAGAWLIRRRNDDVNHAQVTVYDTRRPGEVAVAVGVFDVGTGSLLRELRQSAVF